MSHRIKFGLGLGLLLVLLTVVIYQGSFTTPGGYGPATPEQTYEMCIRDRIISRQSETIAHLQNYISGSYPR